MSTDLPPDSLTTLSGTTVVNQSDHANISDVALMVGIESMNVCDDKVNQYYAMVHAENIELENMNNAMALAQSQTNVGSATSSTQTFTYKDPDTGETSQMGFKAYCDKEGIDYPKDPDNKFSKDEWNSALQNVKSASDSISSTNQVDMMKLQSILNKANQSSEQTSDIMSKANSADMAIIGNMAR
ncbi:MAG: hypothetical protein GY701_18200 [Sulfitobacter sp.]|nr:hypothetical protein [Sulfitobacter sp.]